MVQASLTRRRRALLQRMRRLPAHELDDVLLAALARASPPGRAAPLLIELEATAARPSSRVDVSRTVGWFTAIYPVLLTPADASPAALLRSVHDQSRRCRAAASASASCATSARNHISATSSRPCLAPSWCFNYLGHFDLVRAGEGPLHPASEPIGPHRSLRGLRSRATLDITAYVSEGTFHLAWAYSKNLYRRETLERLSSSYLEHLRALLATAPAA